MIVDPADLELDPASEAFLETDTTARRNLEVLREYAARAPSGKPKALRLRFCVSPVAILGDEQASRRSRSSATSSSPTRPDGSRRCATDEREVLPCGLVLRSVGYRGAPVGDVPFDERSGTIPNDGGRIVDETGRRSPAPTARAGSSAARAA